jgi:hypothetical protein
MLRHVPSVVLISTALTNDTVLSWLPYQETDCMQGTTLHTLLAQTQKSVTSGSPHTWLWPIRHVGSSDSGFTDCQQVISLPCETSCERSWTRRSKLVPIRKLTKAKR